MAATPDEDGDWAGWLVAATDGSCIGNPGPGGWAWVTADGREGSAAARSTTNNRMELRALLELLRNVEPEQPLLVQIDSQYVIKVFTEWLPQWSARGWRTSAGRPVENRDLIEATYDQMQGRDVSLQWVEGHVGHPLNESADTLANSAARRAVETVEREARERND